MGIRAIVKFGRLLADYAYALFNSYGVYVTSLAAMLSFTAQKAITRYTRPVSYLDTVVF
ncbi:hypothetical protein BH20ACI3_BH20ACI3_41750 [soil metagenome]